MTHYYVMKKATDMPYAQGEVVWIAQVEVPDPASTSLVPGQEIIFSTDLPLSQPLFYNYKPDGAHDQADPVITYSPPPPNAMELDFYSDNVITQAMEALSPELRALLRFIYARLDYTVSYNQNLILQRCTEMLNEVKAALPPSVTK